MLPPTVLLLETARDGLEGLAAQPPSQDPSLRFSLSNAACPALQRLRPFPQLLESLRRAASTNAAFLMSGICVRNSQFPSLLK